MRFVGSECCVSSDLLWLCVAPATRRDSKSGSGYRGPRFRLRVPCFPSGECWPLPKIPTPTLSLTHSLTHTLAKPYSDTHTRTLRHRQQKKTRVRIWLYEDTKMQLEGQIIGFDEYMNMVLDDAVEIGTKKRNDVGRILLKGDAITCIQEANPVKQE